MVKIAFLLLLLLTIMQCFIYKSLKKDYLYLYIAIQDDFSKIPEELLTSLGRLEFVMPLDITPERKLAREVATKVIESLTTKGFFVQLPPQKETA